MAIAGINNVSVLESSYLGENYPPVSRRWGNQERPITRTSFIRKMWRDLEGENRFRDNENQQTSGMVNGSVGSPCSCSSGGDGSEDASVNVSEVENECPQSQNQVGLQNRQEDNGDLCSHRSPAFGVEEKQRVRQVFREWRSKSFNGRPLNVSHKNNPSRAQRFCENECKRVRTVRQWVESNTQQAETSHSGVEERATEIGCQIEQVRDGSGVNHSSIGAQGSIRRLYGRQALLELLRRFEKERKEELLSLWESRPVTNFAHRNRLQSLLKGRFLWNQRFVQDEKSNSIAASELGLFRQTHSVSDLRKEFLSRVDNSEHASDGPQSDTSSDNGMKYGQENLHELPDDIVNEFEAANTRSDIGGTHKVDSETDTCASPQDYSAPEEERHERALEDEEMQQPPTKSIETRDQDQEQEGPVERNQGAHHIELSLRALELECTSPGPPSPNPILHGQFESNGEELEVHETSDQLDPSETNSDCLSWQEGPAEAEEWQEPVTADNGSEWRHHLTNTLSDANSIENDHEWYQETAGSDYQESHDEWYNNALEDTTAESWFGAVYQEAPPVVRANAFYTSDDDNGYRLELRELMSRRRVSNLLQSDFRGRLDQLIQSYVERQDQASESDDEWMLEREQQDQDQQSVDENDDANEAVETMEASHSSLPAIPQTHQHLGSEWEMVNGLRIDMVRLQEQMNSMQKMLETCMNVQLEVQRTVQQEVLSALNRSSNSGKEEACSLCSDDTSHDRSGRVYICSRCAQKINWSSLKESVRHP